MPLSPLPCVRPRTLLAISICATVFALVLFEARRQHAASILVNSTSDVANGSDGLCTLREAITAANSNTASGAVAGECTAGSSSGSDTIDLTGVTGAISLTVALPDVNSDMTINGPGASTLTVQRSTAGGTPNFRIFTINLNRTVGITGLTMSNGNVTTSVSPANCGGAVFNSGTLTLTNSTLSGNSSINCGGGIFSNGTLTLKNSTVTGNSAVTWGGGVFTNLGLHNLINVTVSGNQTAGEGGGVMNFNGNITLTNVTVTNNRSDSNDNGGEQGGGMGATGGIATLKNTIVARNFRGSTGTTASDLTFGSINSSSSFNLIGTGGTGGLLQGVNNNQVGVSDPRLGTLQNNGGPTMTHALLPGSPAHDAGDNSITGAPLNISTDQRDTGFNRVADANGDGTATVDVGAYEVQSLLVTNLNDSGAGSLRQAVTDANANAGTEAINFQAGLTGTISLLTVLPNLSTTVAINGPGATVLTVQRSTAGGTPTFGIFGISSSVVTISGLTVSNGNQSAISNGQGTLTINNCMVTGNSGTPAAVFNNGGTLTINNSTISNNTTGGIDSQNAFVPVSIPAVATINNSTISGNASTGAFAGIRNVVASNGSSTMTINNSTVSGNIATSANGVGGVLDFATLGGTATLVINNSTIYGNTGNDAAGRGGVAQQNSCASACFTVVKLFNTIVAANLRSAAVASDISGTVDSTSSFNLIGTGGSGGLTNGVNNNQVGVASPGLGPLANNGGPTQTHALLTGSPALDTGSNAVITNPPLSGPPFYDQRGAVFSRIVDGPDVDTTATVDVGAYEMQAQLANLPDITSNEDTQVQVAFDVGDASTVSSINVSSSNASLVPNDSAHLSAGLFGSTGVVTINPATNANGSTNITITVNRTGGGSDVKTFLLTVNPINDAPIFTKGSDQTVNEDAGAQSVNNWATAISPGPADESGQVSFTVTNNTNGALFSSGPAVSPTGTLTYTPAANANGSATITLVLKDDGGTANGGVDTSASQTFNITVSPVNDAPSFIEAAGRILNEDAGPQTVNNWAAFIAPGPANESGQTVSFNITNNSNAALFSAGPAVSSTGTLTFTPAANANGSATMTVNLIDDGGTANGGIDTSPRSLTITVNPVNDVPSFTKGTDQAVNEDAGAQTVANWATSVSAGPANESSQTLTFTATNDNNALFSAQPAVSPSGALTYTPAANAHGTATVSVTLKDNGGTANGGVDTSAAQTFTITVNSVNDVPSFTKGPDQTANQGSGPQTVNNWATGISPGPADEAGQTVSFTVTNNTNPGLFSSAPAISSTGTLTYTPAINVGGTATVTVVLKDNGGTANGGVDTSAPQSFDITINPAGGFLAFSASSYNTTESSGSVTVTAKRTGFLTQAVTVDYATSADNGMPCSTAGGVATPKCDFTTALGTVSFAAGEDTKTITILISQDVFVEGPETFSIALSNPTGGSVFGTPVTSTITIADDATEPTTNPIDDARNFVRQHYHDFLSREPDTSGWDFWTNQITSCGSDVQCNEVRRIDVSASFFLSIEFQQSGYLVERFYKVGYGDGTGTSTFGSSHQLSVPIVRFDEFLRDTQRIGKGVIVLQPGWEQALEANKQAYALEFVQTARFTAANAFPTTMTPAQFVDKLNQNAGNVLSASERTTAINLFSGAGDSSNQAARAQAVRTVAEDADLFSAEYNRAFVLAEYFGYLRRNPNDAPESTLDYTGYDFWLTKLNQFNGNYINAEMVKAFLSSIEYRQRFGP